MSETNSKLFHGGIYLDHASTTPDFTRDTVPLRLDGNSHSIHQEGLYAAHYIKESEKIILDHINGHDGKLLWFSTGSQANTAAIRATCCTGDLLTTTIEHKSIRQWSRLSDFMIGPERHGHIDPVNFLGFLDRQKLASVMLVNNETGIVNDIQTIGENIPEEIYFHSDAVQALGKIPIDVEAWKLDLLTLSAHKAYGPKGIACLWVRNKVLQDVEMEFPYLGTLSPELIRRFGVAVKNINFYDSGVKAAQMEHIFLTHLMEEEIEFKQSSTHNRMAGHLSLCFPDIDNDELVFSLSDRGVYISTGSACDSGKVEPSHVLSAMGIPEEEIKSTVRVTFGHAVTYDQCRDAAKIIASTIRELKENGS